MRYTGTVYRPPSEAGSVLVQATIGCPHNRCRFCGMYKDQRFRIRTVKDILEDLEAARQHYGSRVRTMFLPDGNTIIMKTASLERILNRAYELFPQLERVTVYGSTKYIRLKTDDDMKRLRRAGLKRIHMGLESGDDETLALMCKGATAAESIQAGRKVKDAGIELSVYYLVGIGGRQRMKEHAQGSAAAINAMSPDFIRMRTYYPVDAAPLWDDIQAGRFELPEPDEALRELEMLIERLEAPAMVVSDHVSNYLNLTGRIPEDKADMLGELRQMIASGKGPARRRLTWL